MAQNNKNPTVFISYSWSSKEYEKKVYELACKLKSDGIVVLLDKWMMRPGTDNINFMEKCVKDNAVDYVLILLDKTYTEKANNRVGGVGIETQIISKEVYEDVEQTKFIPVVFDRDEDGTIFIPIYLKNRFHIDLTKDDPEAAYIDLVKIIYGKEICIEPELGPIPNWIDDEKKENTTLKFKINLINDEAITLPLLLNCIKESELGEILDDKDDKKVAENYVALYNNSLEYRNMLLDIFSNSSKNGSFVDNILEFYDELKIWNNNNSGIKKEIWSLYIHETFIYLIACLFSKRLYKDIYTLITKTYFINRFGEFNETTSNEYFYFATPEYLDNAIKIVDGTNYYSGIAKLWITNLYTPMFTKSQFVTADLLIHNLSILLFEDIKGWYWFPRLYIYGNPYQDNRQMFKEFCIKLKSKYEYNKMIELFGGITPDKLNQKFKNMIAIKNNISISYRYPGVFEEPELIIDYIKPEDIASLN